MTSRREYASTPEPQPVPGAPASVHPADGKGVTKRHSPSMLQGVRNWGSAKARMGL